MQTIGRLSVRYIERVYTIPREPVLDVESR